MDPSDRATDDDHPDGALRVRPELEAPGAALRVLAYNLRWSWHRPTTELFASLAPHAWATTRNPIAVLRHVEHEPHLLATHAARILDLRVELERYLRSPSRIPAAPRVAYLSAEFAIADCLPIYSGGLGVLAGDHLKSASDLGLPLAGVSLLYRYGYFRQVIDETGYQRERYDHLNTEDVPLLPVRNADGSTLIVPLPFPGRTVFARAWLAQVGRVPLYLLDTELPENREDDRWITGHLYGGDQDTRIRQELVLGVGGARLLRAVLPPAAQPQVFHMNEGHSAFITLELARERLAAGAVPSLADGVAEDARALAFTTHTPVAAGHDEFPSDLVEAYFQAYRQELGVSHAELMRFGRRDPEGDGKFNMTVLAVRGAAYRNAVSQLHARVSRHMLGGIGVGLHHLTPVQEMDAITNGVHTATWAGPELSALFDAQLGPAWREAPDEPASWSRFAEVDRAALWAARTAQRRRLLERVEAGARVEGLPHWGPEITPERVLVLGFARRFATYKRAGLMLADPDRLARLLAGDRPVVVVFAGKAHPRDDPAKLLLQRIVQAAYDPRFRGRLVFLENYDVELARFMVQGCDVWLNTPRRPMEASGTSGMKAVLNGSLHLSELDGWWDEAYRPGLGWALGSNIPDSLDDEALDAAEGHQLMHFLEREVTPLFFDRNEAGEPLAWLDRVVASVRSLVPPFSSQRMVREYAERFYIPAGAGAGAALPR
jgi:glycogen phosphorylase